MRLVRNRKLPYAYVLLEVYHVGWSGVVGIVLIGYSDEVVIL